MADPKKILIVEDHRIMRDSLQEFLSEVFGVVVCGIAETGEAAFALCDKLHPEIVLIDVFLPGMSGLELAERLSESQPAIVKVMLSGHQELTYVRRAVAAGARGYVLKGEPTDIVVAIDEVTHGRTYFTAELREGLEFSLSHSDRHTA